MGWFDIGDLIVDIVAGGGLVCLLGYELYRIKLNKNKKRL